MKKHVFSLLIGSLLILSACNQSKPEKIDISSSVAIPEDYVALFYSPDDKKMTYYGKEQLIDKRFSPCSTFKIISTLIGLENNVISQSDDKMGYDGTHYDIAECNKDVSSEEAFRASCIWYYKKMTAKMEKPIVQTALNNLDYGNKDLYVWNDNGHNVFWVESSLQISPIEQVKSLEKIFSQHKIFSENSIETLQKYMYFGDIEGIKVYGKTGTGRNHNSGNLEAWYTGFYEDANGKKVYFAAHGGDKTRNVSSPEIRQSILEIIKDIGVKNL